MCPTAFSDNYNPPLKSVQLVVFEVLMSHENTEILPYVDYNDLSPGNNDPIEDIMIFLVVIPIINQLGLVELAKEDRA